MSRILIKQNVNKFGEKIFIFFQKPILVFSFKDVKLNENDKSETHSFRKKLLPAYIWTENIYMRPFYFINVPTITVMPLWIDNRNS